MVAPRNAQMVKQAMEIFYNKYCKAQKYKMQTVPKCVNYFWSYFLLEMGVSFLGDDYISKYI